MAGQRWTMLVSGRVQGVYYRASTVREATRLGLTGYARNLADGRVEVVAEGDEGHLGQLYQWCQEGPPEARVTSVEVSKEPAMGGFRGFEIAR